MNGASALEQINRTDIQGMKRQGSTLLIIAMLLGILALSDVSYAAQGASDSVSVLFDDGESAAYAQFCNGWSRIPVVTDIYGTLKMDRISRERTQRLQNRVYLYDNYFSRPGRESGVDLTTKEIERLQKYFTGFELGNPGQLQSHFVLPAQTRSIRIHCPPVSGAKKLFLSLQVPDGTGTYNACLYEFLGEERPTTFRIPVVDQRLASETIQIPLKGYVHLENGEKQRIRALHFSMKGTPGEIFDVDLGGAELPDQDAYITAQFRDGEPAAFAKIVLRENGHSAFWPDYMTDSEGRLRVASVDSSALEIFPAMDALCYKPNEFRWNIDYYFDPFGIFRSDDQILVALAETPSIKVKCDATPQRMTIVYQIGYFVPEPLCPYALFESEIITSPFSIRIPIPLLPKGASTLQYRPTQKFVLQLKNEGVSISNNVVEIQTSGSQIITIEPKVKR